jgi:hypothetical protein
MENKGSLISIGGTARQKIHCCNTTKIPAVIVSLSDGVHTVCKQFRKRRYLKFYNPKKQKIMGTIQKGILGGFSGKVGTVIGGTWKGIDYMRSKGNNGNRKPTETQQAQQLKFALVMHFVQPMASLLETSFHDFAIKMTGINNAFAYNLKNAVTGVFPSFAIDYSHTLVSRGKLPNVLAPTVTSGVGSILTFSWMANSGVGLARATDKAILVAYCPELRQAIFSLAGGLRSDLTGELNVLPFSGLAVQTWVGFISETGRLIATSNFTGEVIVS